MIQEQVGSRYDSGLVSMKAARSLSDRLLSEAFGVPRVGVEYFDPAFSLTSSYIDDVIFNGNVFEMYKVINTLNGRKENAMLWCAFHLDDLDLHNYTCYLIPKSKASGPDNRADLCRKKSWALTPLCKEKQWGTTVNLKEIRKEARVRYLRIKMRMKGMEDLRRRLSIFS